MFEVNLDTSEFDEFLKKLDDGFASNEMKRILELAASYLDFKILERTAAGVDFEGRDFKPYAPLSVRLRSEAGLPTRKVDLFFTGHMTNALTHKVVNDKKSQVYFLPGKGSDGLTADEKMLKNNPVRPFFGVSMEDRDNVFKIVNDELDRLFR